MVTKDGMGKPIEPERLYYLQYSEQMVGNCMMFWCPDGKGYTTQLDQAGLYPGHMVGNKRDIDVPWLPEDLVPGKVVHVRHDRLRVANPELLLEDRARFQETVRDLHDWDNEQVREHIRLAREGKVTEACMAYLASPDAERDVADLLAQPAPGLHARRHLRVDAVRATGIDWFADRCGPWIAVSTPRARLDYASNESVTAYFRVEGERFLVSDLGEGVRELRMRTGCSASDASWHSVGYVLVKFDGQNGVTLGSAEGDIQAEQSGRSGVPSALLPRAICDVMLAAHLVAHLELP